MFQDQSKRVYLSTVESLLILQICRRIIIIISLVIKNRLFGKGRQPFLIL